MDFPLTIFPPLPLPLLLDGQGAHNWGGPDGPYDEEPAPIALDKNDPLFEDDDDLRKPVAPPAAK